MIPTEQGGLMKSNRLAAIFTSLAAFALIIASIASPVVAEPAVSFTVNANTDMVDAMPGDGICETASGNSMCTLRAAIMEANARVGSDTIYLPAATYHLTIPGAGENGCLSGDLDITESLTIIGDQTASSIIDANGLVDRVLHILSGDDSVSISNVTLQNGFTNESGGGIASAAFLELDKVVIRHSHADAYGGGIFANQSLTMTGGFISQNSASWGGGIFITGSLSMKDVLIDNNVAQGFGGGLVFGAGTAHLVNTNFDFNAAPDGGAGIYNVGGNVTILDSYFHQNYANSAGGTILNTGVGNVMLQKVEFLSNFGNMYSAGILNDNGTVTGEDLLFDGNDSPQGIGTAISNVLGAVNISRSVFSNNIGHSGGAIGNRDQGTLFLWDSTVITNTARFGGGIFNQGNIMVRRVSISANTAINGGGIYNMKTFGLTNATISGNKATNFGGGIYNTGTAFSNNLTITSNVASLAEMTGFGGGVYNQLGANFTLRNTIIYGNSHVHGAVVSMDDCYGTLNTQHYNLVYTLNNCTLNFSQGLDLTGINPQLGVLADNGGPTQTHALLDGSPAIDTGNPNACYDQLGTTLTMDQRGYPRTWDGDADGVARCDIGAYEYASRLPFFLPLTLR